MADIIKSSVDVFSCQLHAYNETESRFAVSSLM